MAGCADHGDEHTEYGESGSCGIMWRTRRRGFAGETTNRPETRGRRRDGRVRAHRACLPAARRRHPRLRAALLLLDRGEPRRERDRALGRRRQQPVRHRCETGRGRTRPAARRFSSTRGAARPTSSRTTRRSASRSPASDLATVAIGEPVEVKVRVPVTFVGFFDFGRHDPRNVDDAHREHPERRPDRVHGRCEPGDREHRFPMLTRGCSRRARRRPRALGHPDPGLHRPRRDGRRRRDVVHAQAQLQNRADAAALAAGVEYASAGCARAAATRRTKAAAESGDRDGGAPVRRRPARRPDTLRNTEVTEHSARQRRDQRAAARLERDQLDDDTSWNDPGVDGGLGPVRSAPGRRPSRRTRQHWSRSASASAISGRSSAMFGVDLLGTRRTRASSSSRRSPARASSPSRVPEQDIVQAQIRYYRECGPGIPTLLATVAAQARSDADYQTAARGHDTLGPDRRQRRGRRRRPDVMLNMPATRLRAAPGCDTSPSRPRCGSRASNRTSSTSTPQTCAQLAALHASRTAGRAVSNIRVFKDDPPTRAVVPGGRVHGGGRPGVRAGRVLRRPTARTDCRVHGSVAPSTGTASRRAAAATST